MPAAESQIARIAEMSHSFQSGILYPRWASHFHYGYGSLLFNYLPPLPHYLGAIHLLLTQTSPAISVHIIIIFAIFLMGFGIFSFTRKRFNDVAGMSATLVYLITPIIYYDVAFVRVELDTLLSLGLFPWILWFIDRIQQHEDRRDMVGLGITTMMLIFSSLEFGVSFLFISLLWVLVSCRGIHVLHTTLGFLFGIGASAIYWLPAALEAHNVHWVAYETHLLQINFLDIIAWTQTPNPDQLNLTATHNVGIATFIFWLIGGSLSVMQKSKEYFLLFAIGGITLGVATQVSNAWLDNMAQFPHLSRPDLLIVFVAMGAILAGYVTYQVAKVFNAVVLRTIANLLLLLIVVGVASPTLQLANFAPYSQDDPLFGYLRSEISDASYGTLHYGALLPSEVAQLPPPSLALLDSYEVDQVMKIERVSRLPTSNFSILSHSPIDDTFRLNVDRDTTFEILTLGYLGWRASFQGQSIPTRQSELGLLEVDVASGQGDLVVYFDSTLTRQGGTLLTIASSILMIGFLFFRPPRQTRFKPLVPPKTSPALIILFGMMALSLITIAREREQPITRSAFTPYPLVLDGGIDFLGYEIDTTSSATQIDLYWQPTRTALPAYIIQLTATDTLTGETYFRQRHAPGGLQTSDWQQGYYIRDQYLIPTSGEFEIDIQVIACDPPHYIVPCNPNLPLRVFLPRGNLLGTTITIPVE